MVDIPASSSLVNQSIKEAAIRTRTGASIVGILHGSELISNPKADYTFREADLVAVIGNLQERNDFRNMVEHL